jgi:hypothetical protein
MQAEIARLRQLLAKANLPCLEAFGAQVDGPDGDTVCDCYYNVAHEQEGGDIAAAIAALVNAAPALLALAEAVEADCSADVHTLAGRYGVRYREEETASPGVAFYAFTYSELEVFVAALGRKADAWEEALTGEVVAIDGTMRTPLVEVSMDSHSKPELYSRVRLVVALPDGEEG